MSYCFFFKQKTAYEMRISDWSSDVCSSDLLEEIRPLGQLQGQHVLHRVREADLRGEAHELPRPRPGVQPGPAQLPRRPIRTASPGRSEIGRASCRERVCQYVSISEVAV